MSTTSFGGGGDGGLYKTTAFIHGAFDSKELGVDKSEGLEVRKCLSGMGDRHCNPPTFTPGQWRPEPKGRQIFWIRRGGLWPIAAIMHKMFTFAIEQSEFLQLCVCVGYRLSHHLTTCTVQEHRSLGTLATQPK